MTPDLSGLAWKKSSRSGGNGQCVEVATEPCGRMWIRDSKNPGPAIRVNQGFLEAIERGLFDH